MDKDFKLLTKKPRVIEDNDDEDSLYNYIIEDDSEDQDEEKLFINCKEIEEKNEKDKFTKDLEEIINNFIKKYKKENEDLKKENQILKSKLEQIQKIIYK